MNHPEILLVPLLMLCDCVLSALGAKARDDKLAQRLRTHHVALNPLWRRAVATRGLRPAYIGFVLLATVGIVAASRSIDAGSDAIATFLGFVAGLYGAINGQHLANLAIARYVKRHRHDIEGSVSMSEEMALWLAMFPLYGLLLPFVLVALCAPQPAMVGAVGGVLTLMFVHRLWIAHHARAQHRELPRVVLDEPATMPASPMASVTRLHRDPTLAERPAQRVQSR